MKKIICCLLGCRKFKYHSDIKRECLRCGDMQVFIKFYPRSEALWIEKSFVDHWETYENIVVAERVCACCFQPEETHTCGSC